MRYGWVCIYATLANFYAKCIDKNACFCEHNDENIN